MRYTTLKSGKTICAVAVLIVLLLCFAVYTFRTNTKQTVSISRTAFGMGSVTSLTLYADTGRNSEQERKAQLQEAAEQYLELVDELDRNVLSWRSESSEVYRFNQNTGGEAAVISPVLAGAVSESLAIAEQSDGAMDITLRPVISLWGIESWDGSEAYLPPSEDSLSAAAVAIGTEHLTFHPDPSGNSTLAKDNADTAIDLGAVGKGYALDLIAAEMKKAPIRAAIAAVGGSILAYGDKGEAWQIGIRDPEGSPADYLGILTLPGESGRAVFVSTSGGYEKFAEADGKIYEHIIDGRTLHPAESGLYSVTIVTDTNGLDSDGLSTACYILGREASAPLLEHFRAEAIFVTRDKTVYTTSGLDGQLTLTAAGYRMGTR